MSGYFIVQPVAQLFAGFEERCHFFGDGHTVARARVASDAGRPLFDRKCTKAAKLDAVAATQCITNLVQNTIDDRLNVALVKMRGLLGNPGNEF